MNLIDVGVTTSLDANRKPVVEAIAGDGTTEVLTTTSFRLRFDRFLLPATAVRQSVCLRSATEPVTSIQDCTGGVLLEPAYDPVRRMVTYRQAQGSTLAPSTEYQLTVLSPPEETKNGFRAFDGAPLAENVEWRFKTAATDPPTGAAEAEKPLTGDLFCCYAACDPANDPGCSACPIEGADGVFVTLTSSCAFSSCHAANTTTGVSASMGLDMSSDAFIALTAIEQVAHQTQTGESASQATIDGDGRFGRAMPVIGRGNPGNSYLLYKALAEARNYSDGSPPLEEIDRLRASVVVGMPMPPTGNQVPLEALDLMSAWIADGAPVRACF